MRCLSCRRQIEGNLTECPFCHKQYNAEKLRFIKYIGDEDSLVGCQNSYKLVLLKNIFELVRAGKQLSVDDIMYNIKEFYLSRTHSGLPADYDVDDRIKNISPKTSIYDMWAVFKTNAYNVINNQGFLFLEKNDRGELIFVLAEDITRELTEAECNNLIELLEKKLIFYYSRAERNDAGGMFNESGFQAQSVIAESAPQSSNAGKNVARANNSSHDETDVECRLDDTSLSVRAKNVLSRAGYNKVGDILETTEEELASYRNSGYSTVHEILNFVQKVREVNGLQADKQHEKYNVLLQPIKYTILSNRAKNSLLASGYRVVGDIIKLTEAELWEMHGVGANTVQEILLYCVTVKQKLADEAVEYGELDGEAIKYPYNNIHTECEQIPIFVLSYFGIPQNLIRKFQSHGIDRLGQLKLMDYSDIRRVLGNDWNKLLRFTLDDFASGIILGVKAFLDNISEEEDLSFIVKRSRGATLQEIGEKHGMTREGVRGKIEKPLNFIKPMAVCLIATRIHDMQTEYLTLQDIYDIYDNDDYDAIISYALRESETIETVESLEWFFIKREYSYNELLQNAINEYVGEGVNWHRNINQLIEILQAKNLAFVGIDDAWLYMQSLGYKVYGEYVAPRNVSYGALLAIIIEEEFPDGIAFSDASAMSRLRRRAFERFDLNLPKNDRAVISRVADFLVICDRGRWIAPGRVDIEISTLETIKEHIDQSPNNIIYYQALFNQFEGLLTMTSNVSNYHYLHGVLKLYYGNEYKFGRDCLQKEADNGNGSLAKRIYDYILGKGQAASRKELKEHLKITSDVMILNSINSNKDLFQWEYNYYNCLGNIQVVTFEEELLHEIIAELFAKNRNYCSAKMVFEYCEQLLPEFIERNHIKNPSNLYYTAVTLIGERYKCRYPHILPIGSNITTTEDIARMFINDAEVLKWDEFSAWTDSMGWGQSTASLIFSNITNEDYYRISGREYLRKDKLIFTEEQICLIKEGLDLQFEGKPFIGSWDVDYHMLPYVGHEWTPYLLDTVVTQFVAEYRMVSPYYGARKAERALVVPSQSELETYDEVVASVVRAQGRRSLTENELYTLLVLTGVIKGVFPNELRESNLFAFKDGIYTLKESA